MSALTHLTLFHSSEKASQALRFGFEREGTLVARANDAKGLLGAIKAGSQLIITGAETADDARANLALIGGVLSEAPARVRVLYFGNAISREEALGAGAHEFLGPPAFIRDVVTLSKLMATPMERRTQSISGELSEHFGLFYLVRALGSVKYTGVLTLLRGLRRGELRFYEGEVTSGQMGALHGLAALHQSLLWTHARFDLREEATVHRRQIPLERTELLRDCERFLREIRSVAGGLSPSAVLERNSESNVDALPPQVMEILELFDGTCSVADVIEDSPYRVFETLRIACRLAEQGFVHRANRDAPKHLMHTALAIEEWLVSGAVETQSTSEEARPPGPERGKPASPPQKGRKKKRGRRRTSASIEPPNASSNEQSWTDLLPTVQTSGEIAQVVPATSAVGEISVDPNRPSSRASRVGGTEPPPMPTRERLEERGGVESLANIFVDASLGAKSLANPAASDGVPATSNGVPEVASWEEQTAPAMPTSLAVLESAERENEASDAAADAKSEPESLSEAKADAKASVDPSTKVEEPPKVVVAVEESLAESEETDKDAAAAKASDAPAQTTGNAKPKKSKSRKSKKKAKSRSKKPTAKVAPKNAWDAEGAEAAKAVVAETAKDAALAIGEILKAAESNPKIFAKAESGASKSRADSKSESDAQEVQELASAAEAAGRSAAHFSAEEEAFFDRGTAQATEAPPPIENFDDLDEDYEIPKTFWQRFLSNPNARQRKKKKR